MDFVSIIPKKHKFLQIIGTIAKVPELLYVRGTLPDHRLPTVAIVGTRKPTAYGKEVTYRFAHDLAKRGVVIMSGLAYGVDAIAHRAALDAGGITIAVLGNGIDSIYPRANQRLADDILAQGGALISEYAPGASVQRFNFLARNRLVSGISDAVIVTEAAARSGSLATVNHALEQGKDVYAVPGNITSPMSEGCNAIIKQGAMPLTDVQDLLEVVAPQLLTATSNGNPSTNPIISLIKSGISDGDQLLEKSGMEASQFLQALSLLEIEGSIRSLGGNNWAV